MYCWGRNAGTFGNGLDVEFSAEPQLSSCFVALKTISAGFEHMCGVGLEGAAYCWGRNWQGQVGNGRHGLSERRLRPALVRLLLP